MRTPLYPKRLGSQLILLMVLAIVVSQLASLTLFLSETDVIKTRIERGEFLEQTANVASILLELPHSEHHLVINSLGNYRVKYSLTKKTEIDPKHKNPLHTKRLGKLLPSDFDEYSVRLFNQDQNSVLNLIGNILASFFGEDTSVVNEESLRLISSVRLSEDYWLNVKVYRGTPFPQWARSSLLSAILVAVVIIALVIVLFKQITKPLTKLARQARKLGMGERVEVIEENGPADIREAISAFNTMLQRIEKLLVHRTRSLAAISHDIRTPLTSLRLQAEFIEDDELQKGFKTKLDEMEKITEATLSFSKQDSWSEQIRHIELSSFIESITDDLQDLGLNVTANTTEKCPIRVRPTSLRRALTNLIENGVKYGGSVDVSLVKSTDEVKIIVSDYGDGIPESEHERLFYPFERMEGSRSRDSGGTGLGLAIALSTIQAHGGELRLKNRTRANDHSVIGLDAIISLPME